MTTLNDFLSAQLSRAREHRVWRLEQHMDSPASLGRMQQGVRDLLRQSLRLPSWEGDLAMTRKACGTVEDMRLEKLYYTAEDGLRTPAWLLLPYDVTASTPVVVCLHGHGYGSRDIVGLRSEETYQINTMIKATKDLLSHVTTSASNITKKGCPYDKSNFPFRLCRPDYRI